MSASGDAVALKLHKSEPPSADFVEKMLLLNAERFNERHACVTVGSNVRVLVATENGYDLMRLSEFILKYENRTIWDGRRHVNVAQAWWVHPLRNTYERIEFSPGLTTSDGDVYNAWSGFGVDPKPGNCDMYLEHIFENIAQGSHELFRYIVGWLANIVQEPMRKPGTAIAIRGEQGTGKSILGRPFATILTRRHYTEIAGQIPTRFNAHLENRLLLQVEEGEWAGSKTLESPLKHLITADTIQIERKGVDPQVAPNYLRVLFTSNNDWVIPAQADSRRFAVFDAGEKRREDKAYFKALVEQLSTGGTEALLHFLLNYKYDFAELQRVPGTVALAQQKRASLSGIRKWWLDVLTRGALPGDTNGEGLSPNDALYAAYIERASDAGERHRSHETELGLELKQLHPDIERRRLFVNGKRPHARKFPSLAVCRKEFLDATGIDKTWEDDDAEWREA